MGQKQTRTSPSREKGKHLEDISLEARLWSLVDEETATRAGSPHRTFPWPQPEGQRSMAERVPSAHKSNT